MYIEFPKPLSRFLVPAAALAVCAFFAVPTFAADIAKFNAPVTEVCPDEEFEIDWAGPNGADDLIAIAILNSPAETFISSKNTRDGNPARLRAPLNPGKYDIRYLKGDAPDLLARTDLLVKECNFSSDSGSDSRESLTTPSGCSGPVAANVDSAVLVTGIATDYAEKIDTGQFSRAELCAAGDAYASALGQIVDAMETLMVEGGSPITLSSIQSLPGAPQRADIERDMGNARDEFCNGGDEPPVVYPFAITYAYCRMAMVTPANAMDIHLPPGEGTGTMAMADHAKQEVILMTLKPNLQAVSAQLGSGWSDLIDMNATGATGQHIGYATREFEFEYEGGLGGGDGANPLQMLGSMVSVSNTGKTWASCDAPGIDIVRSFYGNLTREMQVDQSGASFFSGLIKNLVGMLREGMPLETEQTVASKIMGKTKISGKSKSVVTGIKLVDFRPEWCSESLMPPEYAVTDIDQQVADALSQAPPGGQTAASPEMADAMQQLNDAMAQMTPEQKAMMEQFGLEGMVGGAVSQGGVAASNQSAPAQGSAANSNSETSNARSADLTTDDLVESVQKHLDALGYDPGTTDGTESVMTEVAIPQFQAENGLPVTGKVTPQLLGILSATVDK
jgi:hypothetical protein